MAEIIRPACISCGIEIRPRQHAISCTACEGWQHRLCNTGISLQQYNNVKYGREKLHWFCRTCVQRYWPTEPEPPVQPDEFPTDVEPEPPVQPDDPTDVEPDDPTDVVTEPPVQPDEPANVEPEPSVQPDESTGVEPEPPVQPNELADIEPEPPVQPDESTDPHEGSLDIGHCWAPDHPPLDESLTAKPDLPDDILPDDSVIRYKVLEKGSERGGRLLVASNGFTFGVKKSNKSSTLWRCSVRSSKVVCRATVIQRGDQFRAGVHPHCHPADPQLPIYKEVAAMVKERIIQQPHSRAPGVVTEIVTSCIPEGQRLLATKQDNLKRIANRYRSVNTPREPCSPCVCEIEPADPLEGSFDIGHCWAPDHPPLDESLTAKPDLPDDILPDDSVIRYKVLEKGSERGGRLLVASNGFTFGVKRFNKSSTLWRCSVRSSKVVCRATVIQRGDQFRAGVQPHCHPADPQLPIYKEVAAMVKERIIQQPRSRALGVVTEVVTSCIPEGQRLLATKQDNLKRIANRYRSVNTPREPCSPCVCEIEPADPLEGSLDIGHCWAPDHPPLDESVVAKPDLPDDILPDDSVIRYKVLEKGSARGSRLLVASNGFTFGVKKSNKSSTLWRCSVRSSKVVCRATVIQRGDQFRAGVQPHCHPADPQLPIYKEVAAMVKERIIQQPHSRALGVVTEVVTSCIPEGQRLLATKQDNLKRIANRYRSVNTPREPCSPCVCEIEP